MNERNLKGASQRLSAGGGFEGKKRRTILVAFGALTIALLLCTTVSANDVATTPDSVDGGGVGTDGGGVGTDGGGVGTDLPTYNGGGVGTDGGGVGTD
jgi:hypothetical protein